MKLNDKIDRFLNNRVTESDEDLFTTDDEDKQAAKDGEELFKHLKKYGAKKVKNMIQFKVGKTSFAVHLK